jgi:hypothetical protein
MKKIFIVLTLSLVSLTSNAQGINIGLGTGTEWFRLEAGYSIDDRLHIGAQLSPGFELVGIPAYYAGFFRYTFDDNEFGPAFFNASFRGYVGASAGLIRQKNEILDPFNINDSEPKSAIGISGNAGVEFLYGRSGRFGSFLELNVGQVPNYFQTLTSEITNAFNDEPENSKIASIWGIAAGIRFYFTN